MKELPRQSTSFPVFPLHRDKAGVVSAFLAVHPQKGHGAKAKGQRVPTPCVCPSSSPWKDQV